MAKGHKGDVLIALSTSGKSENVIRALRQAQSQELYTIAFVGEYTEKMAPHSDLVLSVPSSDTPRIQEVHMLLGHILCEIIEQAFI